MLKQKQIKQYYNENNNTVHTQTTHKTHNNNNCKITNRNKINIKQNIKNKHTTT